MKKILSIVVLVLFANTLLGQQTVELCPWERNTFTYYSSSNSIGSWSWRLGPDTISYSNSVTITWTSPGDYSVIVEFESECSTPKEIYQIHVIECAESAIYFPNAFTPNNDGINDRWGPKGIGIVQLEWTVWNRWGEMIFKSNDLDISPDKCNIWDGTYVKRKDPNDDFYYVQNDVYVYKAYWTDVNGIQGQKIGHIVLIR
jgi:gliding motility-associated-like protein